MPRFRLTRFSLHPAVTFLLAALLFTGCVGQAPPARVPGSPSPAAAEMGAEGSSGLSPDELVARATLEDSLPVDPVVIKGRLDNGLTYVIRHHDEPENRADLWLVINAGSLQEADDQRGLAHYVEHMAFNGTRNFERQELVSYLESIGMRFGPDLNAYTSFDETVYQLRLPTDSPEPLATGLDILQDWLSGISFDPEEVEKERGVLIEEWRLGRGSDARLWDLQYPILFHGSRYADRLVIGDEDSLRTASRDALVRYYQNWYRTDLAAIIAVGDVDPRALEQSIRERFSEIPGPTMAAAEGADGQAPPVPERRLHPLPEHAETLVSVATDPEATSTSVSVYYKHPRRPQGTFGTYRDSLVGALYDRMLNARLEEMRQGPDAPFLFAAAASGNLVRTADLYYQLARVEPYRVTEGLAALIREAERVDRHGFTAGELERARKDLLLAYEQAFEERESHDSRAYAAEYTRHFLDDEAIPGIAVEAAMARRYLREITLEEVNRAAETWISEENRVILVTGLEKEAGILPSEEGLLEVFQEVQAEEIEPYEDRVQEGPLVSELPRPGAVVEETTIPELGVTRWRLANGAEVILKPTDFKRNEVFLVGTSPGGNSLAAVEDDSTAAIATALVGEGGLGRFEPVALEKALAGTRVGVSPFINELEEGIRGSASSDDLETLFALTYLTITEPRLDPEAAALLVSKMGAFVENRLADPDTVYQDKLAEVMTQDHPRRQPWSWEALEEIDVERAFAFYQERFADASDFKFFLVGSFAVEEIRPLVETYLGGLPSIDREESWRDVGVKRPSGIESFTVERGLEPKSQVTLIYSSEPSWSYPAMHQVRSLADVLERELRGVLREDLGGTYGVGVGGAMQYRPHNLASVSITFTCAPENVEELVAQVFATVERVRREGPPAATVANVREAQMRAREGQLRDNGFWLDALRSYEEMGIDPRRILAYEDLVGTITVESLREAANLYLPEDRYVLGILNPEPATETAGAEDTTP